MSKRKQTDGASSDDDGAQERVDVNFDYYDIDADNDYHAIQRLFVQLFGPDVQTGPLTDVVTRVAAESGVGSTIRTEEGEGADPHAVLTVLSCRDHPLDVVDYVRARTCGAFDDVLRDGHVGLVLSERLVNMPVQVMAPMYAMLADEIDGAIAKGRDYRFTHFLFISRAYRLAEEEEERHSKRHKTSQPVDGWHAFHAEDAEIMAHATHTAAFELEGGRAVRVILVPRDQFGSLVRSIRVMYGV